MPIKVVSFEHICPHGMRLQFDDGTFGVHDFATMVAEPGLTLAPLRDPDYFARAFLEFGALTWPNGFDIAPDWLRREMEEAGELTRVA